MRHLKSGRKLGRTASHRKATLANLATALLIHKSIVTTTPKAKEARGTVERLITFAKKGDLAARRHILRTVKDKRLVKELIDEIAPKYAERNGGYTRVIKLGKRKGDNAALAIFEMVGFEGIQAAKIERERQKRQSKVDKERKAKEAKPETEPTKEE